MQIYTNNTRDYGYDSHSGCDKNWHDFWECNSQLVVLAAKNSTNDWRLKVTNLEDEYSSDF